MCSNATRLNLPTGEGAPSKSEGVGGVFYMGAGEKFPSGIGQRPRYLFFMASSSEPFFAIAKNKRGIGGNPRQAVFAPRSG
ncbi:hypothetical protein BtSCAC15_32470 (plasmid) [Bacillus thuringiensis]|nr:hypothetical protein BtSCAC15_32470 [Bacillus thuringiensis]